jgi:2-dehydro-3-deoxygluconokinase
MAPQAFDVEYLDGAKVLHLTGSTSALSDNCRAFTLWAAREARSRGIQVSFDVNYRSKLWSPKKARDFIEEMLPEIDLLLVSAEESLALWNRADEDFLADLAEAGPKELVLKKGKAGNLAWINGEILEQSSFTVRELDPIGAGDAFAAGYLAGWLWQLDAQERMRVASTMGALSVMTLGDYEGLPDREELESFMNGKESLGR